MPRFRSFINPKPSIGFLLTVSLWLVIAMLMATTTLLDLRRERQLFRNELEERGRMMVSTLDGILGKSLSDLEVDRLQGVAKLVKHQRDIRYVRMFDSNGNLMVDTDQEGLHPSDQLSGSLGQAVLKSTETLVKFDDAGFQVASRIESGPSVLGGIELGFGSESMEAELRTITSERLWQFLILVVLAIPVSAVVSQYFTRPIRRLVRAAQGLAQGDRTARVTVSSGNEIGRLGAAFNEMADRIRDSHEDLERQVAQRTSELSKANYHLKDEVAERTRAEEEVKRLAREHAALAEIGRIMTSSLDIDEVYERFAQHVRRLIPFDRIDIVTTDLKRNELCVEYTYGVEMEEPRTQRGYKRPLTGSIADEVIRSSSGILSAPSDKGELERTFPRRVGSFELGMLSSVYVPLVAKGESIGMLALMSKQLKGYTSQDLQMAERVSAQISGTIANAQLFGELRDAQRELRDVAARLERSNKELESFASVAAHDLQEPLRKILTFGDRLSVKRGGASGERGSDYLDRILNAARRMSTLINDLLAFSRVTSKTSHFVPVDLAQVAENVASDLEVRIDETGGRVELGALPVVDADPVQMRQLLQNLIGNGLKFHRPGVAPLVRVHSELLNGHSLNGAGAVVPQWQVCVEDNGIGFEEKYLDRIFSIFQRLHGRSEYEGTGVGLAVCRKIAERHSGSIAAKSIPGRGSTFIVTLPVKQPAEAAVVGRS